MRELYEFTIGEEIFRYCSGEIDVVWNGNTYLKQPITRNEISKSFDVEEAIVELPFDLEPAPRYRLINPIETVRVRILKDNGTIMFIGKVLSCGYSLQKGTATFKIVSLQAMMKSQVPSRTFATGCSFRLFDTNCKVNKNNYRINILKENMTISYDNMKITSSSITSDFAGGFIEFGREKNFITSQSGTTITLLYPMQTISSATSVYLYKATTVEIYMSV